MNTPSVTIPNPVYRVELEDIKYSTLKTFTAAWENVAKSLPVDAAILYFLNVRTPGSFGELADASRTVNDCAKTMKIVANPDGYEYVRAMQAWQQIDAASRKIPAPGDVMKALEITSAFAASWVPVMNQIRDAKKTALKGRKPSGKPRKTPARTLVNTGTCPCCFRNVKMDDGKIVMHGFQLRWHTREGRCFGVNFPAFELSPEGTAAFIEKVLNPEIKATEKELARLNTLNPAETVKVLSHGRFQYETTVANVIHSTKSQLGWLKSDRKTYADRVKNWKLAPLPEEAARAMGILS